MASNFSKIIEPSLFILFPLSVLIDLVLSSTWNRMYFTSGLLLFLHRIPVHCKNTNIPLTSRFEAEFQSVWLGSLVFKEIEPNIYGFREKFFEFRLMRSSSLMHGLLSFDFANHEVVVKGYANWSILYFSLIWLGAIVFIGIAQFPETTLIALAFLGFFILVFGILYWIQYNRFTKVAEFAAREWLRSAGINESIMKAVKRLSA